LPEDLLLLARPPGRFESQPSREEHYADYPDYADYSIAKYFILVDPLRIVIGDLIEPPPPRVEHFALADYFTALLPDVYHDAESIVAWVN
jgi:hypothetical protein